MIAPAAEAETVDSGALRATVKTAPFALDLTDRADGEVLRSLVAPGRDGGLAYGFDIRIPIVNNAFFGYLIEARADTLWFHATGVRSQRREGSRLLLDLTTDDPLGHRIEATLAPAAQGAVELTARLAPGSGPLAALGPSSMSASFAAAPGERYLGFGERSNAVDQTGRSVFNWAEEGPFSAGAAEPLLRPLIPDFTFPNGPATTNFPIPWLVSTRGLGVLIDQTQRSTFHLGDERRGAWRAEAEAKSLALTFYPGPDPAAVVRRYSAAVGRQPAPRGWLFGAWGQFDDTWARRLRDLDVPVTLNQTYTHYLPCGAQTGKAEAERKRVAAARALGYRITTYFNPHVCTTYRRVYDPAANAGQLVRNVAGSPYLLTNPFTADQVVSEIDFTKPSARDLFGRLLDEAIDAGYDGWMEDFGEYTPPDAVFSDGHNGAELHNRYPVLYHCTSTEHTQRRGGEFAVFIRSGFHGVQPCARAVWGGDPTEDWSCADGLCAAVHQALSIGLSGIAYWGSDIGGFHAIVNGRTTDELNSRWLEFGAVSGIMRTQSNGYSFISPKSRRSQVTSPKVLPLWRRYTKLRTQLYPYIQAASRELPAQRSSVDAPARARLPGRPARGGGADRVPLRPRPPRGTRDRARSAHAPALPPARALDRPVALGRLRRAQRRPAARSRRVDRRRARGPAARPARRAPPARAGRRPDPAPAARGGHARRPRPGRVARAAAPAALPSGRARVPARAQPRRPRQRRERTVRRGPRALAARPARPAPPAHVPGSRVAAHAPPPLRPVPRDGAHGARHPRPAPRPLALRRAGPAPCA